ncbi:MAG: SUMF1/EgtB/PvdO family nonheme iron enzyme [Campylobacterota bacterium]|nr:SUMF1/EgtB/PvdO family nonheme iron enzyme [Campylobacterota bacterium]
MNKKIYITLPFFLLFYGCSSKEVCKSPEVLDMSNETMSFIKGGEFLMGDYSDQFGDKKPREVYVNGFYIDRTEVTNGAYRAYTEEKGCTAKPKYIDDPILGADDLPVVSVSHKEAQNYCKFYGKRLPTEAEWEYAARGGLENKKYPWGNEEGVKLMNYRDSNSSWSVPVMSYVPNDYYLYEMTGNVREWVEDSYEKDFYITSCLKSPLKLNFNPGSLIKFGMDSIYKSDCYMNPLNISSKTQYRVNRGGSWEYSEGYPATVSFRFFDKSNARFRDLGFRCAADAQKESWLGSKLREYFNESD